MSASAKPMKDELLTAADTCRFLKIAPRTLYRYIQDRRMPAFKLGKEWRFVRSDLEQWLRRRSARSVAHK
jgi:excisionase family DNA binding protein